MDEQPLGRVVRLVRHHRRVPEEERGLARLGHLDEERDGLHLPATDGQAGVAVPAAAVGVAAGHAVGEPAALVRPAPPLARLEAEVPLRGQQSRDGRHIVEVLDHLLATAEEMPGSAGLGARLTPGGRGGSLLVILCWWG